MWLSKPGLHSGLGDKAVALQAYQMSANGIIS